MELPEQPEGVAEVGGRSGERKLRRIDRSQMTMVQIDVEHLIDEHHPARGIWDVTVQLDLSAYEEAIVTRQGEVGRAAWPPQLLVAIWLYGYSRGITSARELERQMAYEPGLQWLTGLEIVNHHTLSDFRVGHKDALTKLFAEMLVVLEEAGLAKLRLVAHDGTKIRAQAGVDSFRREAALRAKLAAAKKVVEQDPRADGSKRERAAEQRARRERVERAERAIEHLHTLQREMRKAEQRDQARVSATEPEARRMKHGDNAIAPSYNAQVSTDADSGAIVGVHLSQSAEDSHELEPSIEEIETNLGRKPEQVVADGGYTNRESIEKMAENKIEFYGSLPDPQKKSEAAMKSNGIDPKFAPRFFILQAETRTLECPAGKQLAYRQRQQKRGHWYDVYRADGADCTACAYQTQCCPRHPEKGRMVSFQTQEAEAIAAFRRKMASEPGRAIYQRRGAAAEFPFAWLKERMRLRKFRVFGMRKAEMEVVWASLAFNVMLWIREVLAPAANRMPRAA